jgi:hypothetical protein
MSKFDFLEDIFFGRTEKSGRKMSLCFRTENAAKIKRFGNEMKNIFEIFQTFLDFWTFLTQ